MPPSRSSTLSLSQNFLPDVAAWPSLDFALPHRGAGCIEVASKGDAQDGGGLREDGWYSQRLRWDREIGIENEQRHIP